MPYSQLQAPAPGGLAWRGLIGVGYDLLAPFLRHPAQGGEKIESSAQLLERRIPMRADIVPGAKFPDFELTDHTRKRRRLSELQGNDPMILILSRGHFCP